MENRNTFVALGLILLLWLGYTHFFVAPPTPPVSDQQASASAESAPLIASAPPASTPERPVAVASSPVDSAPLLAEERTIDTGVFRMTLTSRGGGVRRVELVDYRDDRDPDSPPIVLFAAEDGQRASLLVSGEESLSVPSAQPYRFSATPVDPVLAPGQELTLSLDTRLPNGLVVERDYHFTGGHYDYGLSVRLVNAGDSTLQGRVGVAIIHPLSEKHKSSQFDEFVGPVVLAADEVEQVDVDTVAEESPSFEQVSWSGFEDKYFFDALVPLDPAYARVRLERENDSLINRFFSPFLSLAPGESLTLKFLGYAGPKDLDQLQPVGHRLSEVVDYGFFSVIANPLLVVLKFFYAYIGNYGVAIILLTVIIKLIFWPLTQKSYQSMKDMQKLQPQMQKLRERYKGDRERLNRELMEMYKTHRVNPMGGCLPMLIQIPVFFALYKVLLSSIELRQAPFMLWITDLSLKDPYYITPLIMGATMFIQQKMTPTTMDPAQARIFMFMPIVFTFLFLNFPSGLVLYWLVNNLLTIGQQYLIHRKGQAPA